MQDEQLIEELLAAIRKNLIDVSVKQSGDTKEYQFKLMDAKMAGFASGAVKLSLQCDLSSSAESKQQVATNNKDVKAIVNDVEVEPAPAEPESTDTNDNDTNDNDTDTDDNAYAIAVEDAPSTPQQAQPEPEPESDAAVAAGDESDEEEPQPQDVPANDDDEKQAAPVAKTPQPLSSETTHAIKCVVGTQKIGRSNRVYLASQHTFDGCEFIPNQALSKRGCVLKKSNAELHKSGVVKKSAIEKLSSTDVSDHTLAKVEEYIAKYSKSKKQFSVTFSIPGLELRTVEVTFNGAFCPNVRFTQDFEGNNFIVQELVEVDDNQYLLQKAKLAPGYKLMKVQGQTVNNKPFAATQAMLDRAGKDKRVKYTVVFMEGELAWYNLTRPTAEVDDEKKGGSGGIALPKINVAAKRDSAKRKKNKMTTPISVSTPMTPGGTMRTPMTPGGTKRYFPKHFARHKKNVTCFMNLRVQGDKRGRIELIVFAGVLERTAKNFIKLCTGKNKGKLSYEGSTFYRVAPEEGLLGGDVENGDGTGTKSSFGGYFDDEECKIRHAKYCLSMKNAGIANTNASSFAIVMAEESADLAMFDGSQVVFGMVDRDSQELLDDIFEETMSLTGKPKVEIKIDKCGVLKT